MILYPDIKFSDGRIDSGGILLMNGMAKGSGNERVGGRSSSLFSRRGYILQRLEFRDHKLMKLPWSSRDVYGPSACHFCDRISRFSGLPTGVQSTINRINRPSIMSCANAIDGRLFSEGYFALLLK